MIRIAICDDDTQDLQRALNALQQKVQAEEIEVDLFDNGDKLLYKMRQNAAYDVIFLDVLMPCLNGIDTAREIRKLNSECAIVFLTNSPEFALDSYSVEAFSYLLKPADAGCMYSMIQKVVRRKEAELKKSILVKSGGAIQKIFFKDILYIEVINNRLLYHLKDQHIITVAGKINELEQILHDYAQFAKPHRSFLVNIDYVEKLASNELHLSGGDTIPLSRNCCATFRQKYLAYYLDQEDAAFV